MSTFNDFEKNEVKHEEYQRWDYLTLTDFKASSCWTGISYGWVWFMIIIAVAVYAADTYTAVNLLIYDRWSSQIQPAIPFSISKWIFAACIALSWLLCAFEWIRALYILRQGSVSKDYLDPVASSLQCMQLSHGRGWRKFLVFAELTKSKRGADYVGLFVYFQFKGAIRIILAEGPRQVINALTLWSVMRANLSDSSGSAGFVKFWQNIEILARTHRQQAILQFTMLFTLVIWVISAISFLIACLLWLCFLHSYIPKGFSLSTYCRKKIERRLDKIVRTKVAKAVEKAETKRAREEKSGLSRAGTLPQTFLQPTLPGLDDDSKSISTTLTRNNTQTTMLSAVPSISELSREPTLPTFGDPSKPLAQPTLPSLSRPGTPMRADSQASFMSNISSASDGSTRHLLKSPQQIPLSQSISVKPFHNAPIPLQNLSHAPQHRGPSSPLSQQHGNPPMRSMSSNDQQHDHAPLAAAAMPARSMTAGPLGQQRQNQNQSLNFSHPQYRSPTAEIFPHYEPPLAKGQDGGTISELPAEIPTSAVELPPRSMIADPYVWSHPQVSLGSGAATQQMTVPFSGRPPPRSMAATPYATRQILPQHGVSTNPYGLRQAPPPRSMTVDLYTSHQQNPINNMTTNAYPQQQALPPRSTTADPYSKQPALAQRAFSTNYYGQQQPPPRSMTTGPYASQQMYGQYPGPPRSASAAPQTARHAPPLSASQRRTPQQQQQSAYQPFTYKPTG